MGTQTANLKLFKADPSETVDVDVDINQNYDKIDLNLPNYVCTSATRPPTPFVGMVIYETNTNVTRLWDGTIWRTQGVTVCTSATRPANPVVGDMIFETDTLRQLLRTSDNKWTTTLVSYKQVLTLNTDQNIAQPAPTIALAKVLATGGVVCDGLTNMRMSAFWPGIKTNAGTAAATDNMCVELAYGDVAGTVITAVPQRTYIGASSNPTQPQNGGVVSVDFVPTAGTWIFYLRMFEIAGVIGNFILYNTGVGTTKFTLEELPGSKY